jgi:MarR family transcriptional regulator for hemolysin
MKNMASKSASLNVSGQVATAVVSKKPLRASKSALSDENNWDQRLGFLMHDVSRLRRVVFDDFMKPLGVTRSQWWVLAYLSRHDGMIQSDLADVLELGKAALGGLIDRLEESGFIERRNDAADRRAKRIHLTRAGAQTIENMRQLSHDMSERILDGLDLEMRRKLSDMLSLVKHNLGNIKRDAGIDS